MDLQQFAVDNSREEFSATVPLTHWHQDDSNRRLAQAVCGRIISRKELALQEPPTCPWCRKTYDRFQALEF